MHRYLIYYKTEIMSFSSCSYPKTEYYHCDSVVVQANSIGEAYDNFMQEQNPTSNDAFIPTKITRALFITDLGELIKDEPIEIKVDIKDKKQVNDDTY